MTDSATVAPAFDTLLNFRDVGETVNQHEGHALLKTRRLFRAARPDFISEHDRSLLLNVHAIKTVIDLRSDTEHIEAAKRYNNLVKASNPEILFVPDSTAARELKIKGIEYREVNLNGRGFERALVWQLKYTSLAKVALWMSMGYRLDAIAVLGREVLQPKGLVGLGMDTLDYSGPEIKQVFDILADEKAYPVMIHCTQGKDRTGLTVFLVLLLCGIQVQIISHDYTMSESELEAEKKQRMAEISSIGLDESFSRCPPDFCDRMQQHLNEHHGGIEAYLEKIGVAADAQNRIRNIILA